MYNFCTACDSNLNGKTLWEVNMLCFKVKFEVLSSWNFWFWFEFTCGVVYSTRITISKRLKSEVGGKNWKVKKKEYSSSTTDKL